MGVLFQPFHPQRSERREWRSEDRASGTLHRCEHPLLIGGASCMGGLACMLRRPADSFAAMLCRWNFCPAPGWTREEAQELKLCLMKFGIGQWQAIHAAGHLAGKRIQQLYGQTQRLLGQQSLAGAEGGGSSFCPSLCMHACPTAELMTFEHLHACIARVAFTGLQVDVDRVRADNELRTDVQRKAGLIIYTGVPPTRAMKEQWRADSKRR